MWTPGWDARRSSSSRCSSRRTATTIRATGSCKQRTATTAITGTTCTCRGSGSCIFFQAEAGIRAGHVTGVQTCALPIWVLDDVALDDLGREGVVIAHPDVGA